MWCLCDWLKLLSWHHVLMARDPSRYDVTQPHTTWPSISDMTHLHPHVPWLTYREWPQWANMWHDSSTCKCDSQGMATMCWYVAWRTRMCWYVPWLTRMCWYVPWLTRICLYLAWLIHIHVWLDSLTRNGNDVLICGVTHPNVTCHINTLQHTATHCNTLQRHWYVAWLIQMWHDSSASTYDMTSTQVMATMRIDY